LDLKPGSRWKSAVCDAEIVVVKKQSAPIILECGAEALSPVRRREMPQHRLRLSMRPGPRSANLRDEETGLEVLCSKTGAGSLSVAGRPLTLRDAKQLPSSD